MMFNISGDGSMSRFSHNLIINLNFGPLPIFLLPSYITQSRELIYPCMDIFYPSVDIYVIYDAGKSLLAAGTPGLKRYQHNFGKNSLPKTK